MIINLDETVISDAIVHLIVDSLLECPKNFRKIAFVGVDRKHRKKFKALVNERGCLMAFFEDYEKAKEWVI